MKNLKFSRIDVEERIPFFKKYPDALKPVIYGSAVIVLIIIIVAVIAIVSSGSSKEEKNIYGEWSNGDGSIIYVFNADGTVELRSGDVVANGTFTIKGTNMILKIEGLDFVCPFVLDNDSLSITGSESGEVTQIYRKDSDTYKKIVEAANAAKENQSSE